MDRVAQEMRREENRMANKLPIDELAGVAMFKENK
jgi:hypothetical protein